MTSCILALFISIERVDGTFNFNGIGANQQGSDEPVLFPNDKKLNNRRDKLENAKEKVQKEKKKGSDLDKSTTTINNKKLLNFKTDLDIVDFVGPIRENESREEKLRKKLTGASEGILKMHKLATDIIKETLTILKQLEMLSLQTTRQIATAQSEFRQR